MDGVEIEDELISHSEFSDTHFETIKELKDIRKKVKKIEVLIEWEGLPDEQDWTWEPIEHISQDIPEVLQKFLESPTKHALKREARKQCQF
eukprot:IDg1866t1